MGWCYHSYASKRVAEIRKGEIIEIAKWTYRLLDFFFGNSVTVCWSWFRSRAIKKDWTLRRMELLIVEILWETWSKDVRHSNSFLLLFFFLFKYAALKSNGYWFCKMHRKRQENKNLNWRIRGWNNGRRSWKLREKNGEKFSPHEENQRKNTVDLSDKSPRVFASLLSSPWGLLILEHVRKRIASMLPKIPQGPSPNSENASSPKLNPSEKTTHRKPDSSPSPAQTQ